MEVSQVSKRDEKCCLQLIDTLKVLVAPPGLHSGDMVKIAEAIVWVNELTQKMAASLKPQAPLSIEKVDSSLKPVTAILDKPKGKK